MFQRLPSPAAQFSLADQFGLRSASQVTHDVGEMLRRIGGKGAPPLLPSTAGFFRPDLSLPAYAGLLPKDGVSPIYNLFDRTAGGQGFAGVATRERARDYRGGRLTYDEHDGTDYVCPPGTPLASAAPGVVVAVRDRFLRGGLTASVDHGGGLLTQYTHLARMVAEIGQRLRRGETVALSGSAGIDMLAGFPWVPPHIHFMVWFKGRPVDPYRADGEAERPGGFLHGNEPETAGELGEDARPPSLSDLEVDERELEAALARCQDAKIRAEIERAPAAATRLALFDDSRHHDRAAWPAELAMGLGRIARGEVVKLTLPLPRALYRRARLADAPWTAPNAS
jgi:murein DD-endopeptidase MepM/ murein hydrolase activator NlpD